LIELDGVVLFDVCDLFDKISDVVSKVDAAFYFLVNLVRRIYECGIDSCRRLCADFEERHAVVGGELLGLLFRHRSLLLQVALIADQHDRNILARILLTVLVPRDQMLKRISTFGQPLLLKRHRAR
jgi:hypothetical protein